MRSEAKTFEQGPRGTGSRFTKAAPLQWACPMLKKKLRALQPRLDLARLGRCTYCYVQGGRALARQLSFGPSVKQGLHPMSPACSTWECVLVKR